MPARAVGLVLLLCGACAGRAGQEQPATAAAPIDDPAGALRELGKDLTALAHSIQHRETKEDPSTFRGRLKAELDKVDARLATLRARLGTSAAPPESELQESEARAAELRKQLDETAPPPSSP